jgi:hypothetical protein
MVFVNRILKDRNPLRSQYSLKINPQAVFKTVSSGETIMRAQKAIDKHSDTRNTPKNAVEYSVYIHLPANQNSRYWEKTSTTHDMQLALEQAEMLHYSQKYPRVEVMRKFFCARRKKLVSETLRIFDATSNVCTESQGWLSRFCNFVLG